jgi:hypothetical protein
MYRNFGGRGAAPSLNIENDKPTRGEHAGKRNGGETDQEYVTKAHKTLTWTCPIYATTR